MKTETKVRPRAKSRIAKFALAFAGAVMLALAPVQVASANQTTLNGAQPLNSVERYNVLRTNSFPQNAVSFTKTGDNKGSGAGLTLGLRNTSNTQYASGTSYGSAVPIRTTAGSAAIPAGSFYINARLVNGSCGTGCGTVAWTANFSWNLRWN